MRHDCPHCINGLMHTGGSSVSSRIPCPYCGGKGYTESYSKIKESRSGCSTVIVVAVVGFMFLVAMSFLDKLGVRDFLVHGFSKSTASSSPGEAANSVTNSITSDNKAQTSNRDSNQDRNVERARVRILDVTGGDGVYHCKYEISNPSNRTEHYEVSIGIREWMEGESVSYLDGYYFKYPYPGNSEVFDLWAQPDFVTKTTTTLTYERMNPSTSYQIWIGLGDLQSEASMENILAQESISIQ